MMTASLEHVAEQVVRRAKRQGHVIPRDVREELKLAGAPTRLWRDVLALARPALTFHSGRYWYSEPVSEPLRLEQARQNEVEKAVRRLIRQARQSRKADRRAEGRVDFIQQVQVIDESGQSFTVLTRDLSPRGIRLLSSRQLVGHKLRVHITPTNEEGPLVFEVRILWTAQAADGLFDNGGALLSVSKCP
jgi:hypothetical protein